MVRNKEELKECLTQDALANRRKTIKVSWHGDDVWNYIVHLRKLELYSTYKGIKRVIYLPVRLITSYKFSKLAMKLGFSIPINVFEQGLAIAHRGTIVVNSAVKVGKNCRIHEGVTIGATNGSNKAAQIGNNVFISSGAKIIGDVVIADDVAIAANAVVVKSILEPGTTWGGVPAHKISDNNSHANLSPLLQLDAE